LILQLLSVWYCNLVVSMVILLFREFAVKFYASLGINNWFLLDSCILSLLWLELKWKSVYIWLSFSRHYQHTTIILVVLQARSFLYLGFKALFTSSVFAVIYILYSLLSPSWNARCWLKIRLGFALSFCYFSFFMANASLISADIMILFILIVNRLTVLCQQGWLMRMMQAEDWSLNF
jgi:hypothetical protein